MLRPLLFAFSSILVLSAPAAASGLTASQSVEIAVSSVDEVGAPVIVYEPAVEVAPGDEVRYVLNYANDGADAASNVRLDMPVPAEIQLIDGSVEAGSADVTYSVDGGATFLAREALTLRINGQEQMAAASDITHIRWSFGEALAPGSRGAISYRGVLQ